MSSPGQEKLLITIELLFFRSVTPKDHVRKIVERERLSIES